MKYETIGILQIPKLGFGTWSIGGGMSADRSRDASSLAALRSALELGYTHFDTAESYADGHTEELIGSAFRETNTRRERVFITSKVKPEHLAFNDVQIACENSLRRLNTDYLDLYLIHWPRSGMNLEETFRALNLLVRQGKIHHLGVSNFNLKLLMQAQSLAATPILTDQVPYNLSDRSYVRNGVLEYCQQNDILLTAYSPLGQGSFKADKTLQAIAAAQHASPQQIALAWLVSQPGVITIPMSADPKHQAENIQAADITLTDGEMNQLSN
ncbi:MAG: hypothetical protein A2Z03_10345 [Chloroflexi bacterium RBG_16_56_8]|nr:MAG: hypothetical protein A2Z03_10345 [Chloroflexi bacterium RBG_16_56_8]